MRYMPRCLLSRVVAVTGADDMPRYACCVMANERQHDDAAAVADSVIHGASAMFAARASGEARARHAQFCRCCLRAAVARAT